VPTHRRMESRKRTTRRPIGEKRAPAPARKTSGHSRGSLYPQEVPIWRGKPALRPIIEGRDVAAPPCPASGPDPSASKHLDELGPTDDFFGSKPGNGRRCESAA
jgi:hypothetical protein